MDREAWRAAVNGVSKSRTRLSDCTELKNPSLPCGCPLLPVPRLLVSTEHEAELPVLHSSSPLSVCLSYSWQRTSISPSLLTYAPTLPHPCIHSLHLRLYFYPAKRLICSLDPLSEPLCSLPWHWPSHHKTLPRGPASRLMCPESFCRPTVSSGHYCAAAEPAPESPGHPLLRQSTLPLLAWESQGEHGTGLSIP